MEPWILSFTGRQVWPLDPRPEMICVEDVARALSLQTRFSGHLPHHYSVAQHSLLAAAIVEHDLTKEYRLFADDFRAASGREAFAEGVARGVPRHVLQLPLAALLHDASEAFLVDLPSPLKDDAAFGAGYRAAEARFERCVEERFGLPAEILNHPVVKAADRRALVTEARDMRLDGVRARGGREGIEPWPADGTPVVNVYPGRGAVGGVYAFSWCLVPVTEHAWRDVEAAFLSEFERLGGKR